MKSFIKRVLATSLLAGTLDILAAYTQVCISTSHVSKKMFNYIAGGALGPGRAMNGGWEVILLGVFFHYFIAFAFTLLFFLIYPELRLENGINILQGFCMGYLRGL